MPEPMGLVSMVFCLSGVLREPDSVEVLWKGGVVIHYRKIRRASLGQLEPTGSPIEFSVLCHLRCFLLVNQQQDLTSDLTNKEDIYYLT